MLHDKKQIPLRQDTLLRSIYLKRGPQPGPAAIARIRHAPAGTRSSAAPSSEENQKETKKKNSCVAMWKQDFPVKLTKANYFPSNVKTKSISLKETFFPVKPARPQSTLKTSSLFVKTFLFSNKSWLLNSSQNSLEIPIATIDNLALKRFDYQRKICIYWTISWTCSAQKIYVLSW